MSDELKRKIRERYAAAASAVSRHAGVPAPAAGAEGSDEDAPCCAPASQGEASCCAPAPQGGTSCCAPARPAATSCCAPSPAAEASCCEPAAAVGSSCCAPAPGTDLLDISQGLYDDESDDLPLEARLASLGCGNPVALAELREGETVLDLGSGGGIDVLLSARRVGPTGKVYGLDMTDEMLDLARRNQREAGIENAEFLKGDIEAVPLPDASVDVIISNCVINLAPDKDRVFAEAFRVLRPGGRLAVADIVFLGDVDSVPEGLRRQVEAWAACVAGALGADDYVRRLQAAGFVEPDVRVVNVYDTSGAAALCGLPQVELPAGVQLASAFVSARKPAAPAA